MDPYEHAPTETSVKNLKLTEVTDKAPPPVYSDDNKTEHNLSEHIFLSSRCSNTSIVPILFWKDKYEPIDKKE